MKPCNCSGLGDDALYFCTWHLYVAVVSGTLLGALIGILVGLTIGFLVRWI